MLTLDEIKRVAEDVLARYDVKEAYLFGSFARGEQNNGSDIDLRLLCGHDMRIQDLYRIELELTRRLGRPVEIVSAPPEELRPRFWDRIKQEEVMLYAS